jgi:hypothetical protein
MLLSLEPGSLWHRVGMALDLLPLRLPLQRPLELAVA